MRLLSSAPSQPALFSSKSRQAEAGLWEGEQDHNGISNCAALKVRINEKRGLFSFEQRRHREGHDSCLQRFERLYCEIGNSHVLLDPRGKNKDELWTLEKGRFRIDISRETSLKSKLSQNRLSYLRRSQVIHF